MYSRRHSGGWKISQKSWLTKTKSEIGTGTYIDRSFGHNISIVYQIRIPLRLVAHGIYSCAGRVDGTQVLPIICLSYEPFFHFKTQVPGTVRRVIDQSK